MPLTVDLDLLLPAHAAGPVPAADGEPLLVALLDRDRDRPHVRATMVTSVDGAATGDDHRSGSLGTPADHRVFAVLRALADVVLVGAGTVRAEGYRELPVAPHLRAARERAGLRPEIGLAVVTRRGDLPADLPPGTWAVTGTDGAARAGAVLGRDRTLVLPSVGDPRSPDLHAAVEALAAHGLRHVLAEGGPQLLADLLASDLVDELCLTTSPVLLAGDAPRLATSRAALDPPRRSTLRHLLHAGDGTLLACWDLRTAVGSVP